MKKLTEEIGELSTKTVTCVKELTELNENLQTKTAESMKLKRDFLKNLKPEEFDAVKEAKLQHIPFTQQYKYYTQNRNKYTKRIIYIDGNNVAIR